jgi:flagellar protein FliO/FliZ
MASTAWSVLMLLVVLALIPATLWGLKRLQNFRPAGAQRAMEVTAQLALGARERVVMLRVEDRVLVLGVTSQQVTLLAEKGDAWLKQLP